MGKENKSLAIKTLARIAGILGLFVLISGSLTHSFNTEIIDLNDDVNRGG